MIVVGIDIIDCHRTETHVTSPAAIRAISRLGGPDVAVKIRAAIEAKRTGKQCFFGALRP
jgi:glutathione synthase